MDFSEELEGALEGELRIEGVKVVEGHPKLTSRELKRKRLLKELEERQILLHPSFHPLLHSLLHPHQQVSRSA